MTPRSARTLRQVTLAAVLAVGLSVAWTFRKPRIAGPAAPAPQASPSVGAARTENLTLSRFTGEKQSFTLQAREMVGQEAEEMRLRGVILTFTFVSQGQPSTGTITSDTCTYSPSHQKAVFRGHVVVTTADGFEFASDSLIYRGDKAMARTEDAVEFRRKDLTGKAVGMSYSAEAREVHLLSQVRIRVQDEGAIPTDIESSKADLIEEERILKFVDNVVVTQGGSVLKAQRFKVSFGEDRVIYRAQAQEDVDLTMSGGGLPGAPNFAAGGASRRLLAKKLDLWFRPDKSLQTMMAGPDAELTVLPGPKDSPERRRLRAKFIEFRFDEKGELSAVQTAKETVLESFPLKSPAKAPPSSTVRCERMLSEMIPGSSEPRLVVFEEKVVLVQGRQKGAAELATYTSATGTLELLEQPELADAEQGTHVKARKIVVFTKSSDVLAQEDVRSVLDRKNGRTGLLAGEAEPAIITARFLDYTSKTRSARYREGALLRSGRDEIRGNEITLTDTAQGRRLEASGDVLALLHPSAEAGGAPKVETRSAEMVYEESARRIDYKGDVRIRQGDISTQSPAASLALTADGRGIETLKAGEPVFVQQGARKATGAWGTYTPGQQTMVLVGDKVTLKDPGQEIQGRSLVFHVGDDRVLVDGREAVRTETIFRKEPPKF